MAADPKTQAKLFNGYILDKKIVIADPSGASRVTIANILTGMGVKTAQIRLTSSYVEAEQEIEKNKPHLVIADFDLGKRCGLDLLQRQRSKKTENQTSIFILVTGNTSQSAVARAAEEDVDTFIIKPFTAGTLRNSILKAVINKIDPPEYVKVIDRGKKEFADLKFDDAMKTFELAKTLDSAPSLGCYYVGQVHDSKQTPDTAQTDYSKGLEYNKIHYKCLVGLFENYMARKKFHEAYNVIKKVSQYFPANPQRLTSVLRLAIMTQSYEDVERYYRIFTSIEERSEEMIKYVCAALVVCGKYYLQTNFGSRALELFQKAAITASGRTRILREIIGALMEHDMPQQADEFLKRFPPETQSGSDYAAMNLLILDNTTPKGLVIEKGRALLNKECHDPVIYKILIKRSAEAGFTEAAEELVKKGIAKYPDQKAVYEKTLALGNQNKGK